MKGISAFIKTIIFLILLGGLFVLLCFVFQPVWTLWNNYDTVHGFYLEPENTIESVFLGPSTAVNGIAPMEIYEKYGYCTYNCGTEQQPMLASYYWLKEAYRFHSDSLKAVFLDPSSMRFWQETSYYQKAIDGMKLSPVKLEAIGAYKKGINERVEYSVPLLEFHDRWDQFESPDDEKYWMKPKQETRGYHLTAAMYVDSMVNWQDLQVHHSWYDPDERAQDLSTESLEYFDKIVSFCREKGLHLVVVIPVRTGAWTPNLHNAYTALAEEYGVECYDFNASPLLESLDFVMGFDHKDFHLNYYGAVKLSDWIGEYLKERGLNRDVRGMQDYEHMEVQLDAWHKLLDRTIGIHEIEDIAEYLTQAVTYENCYVMISVMDEGSKKLTDEQREVFAELGLKKLSELDYRESYIGVMADGIVVGELKGEEKQEDIESRENEDSQEDEPYLVYRLGDGIVIKSGGFEHGGVSSISINGAEHSLNRRGINVVIYDYERDEEYDSAAFDTYASPTTVRNAQAGMREVLEAGLLPSEMDNRVRKLYLYNRRTKNYAYGDYWTLYGDAVSLFAYLDPYVRNPGYKVFISAKDEAARALSPEVRDAFARLGLQELSQLGTRECYIGVLNDGAAYYEQRALGAEPLSYEEPDVTVLSGGFESGNVSSIVLNGREESRNQRGLNIVVYDQQLNEVLSSVAFDTHEVVPDTSLEKSVLNQKV